MEKSECVVSSKELLKLIRANKIIVYGAGYVAERFCNALKLHGLHGQIECLTTTSKSNAFLCDKEIINMNQITDYEKYLFCIAVHESVRDEIIKSLQEKNIYNYVWVYPNLFELILGEPINTNIQVPVNKIWLANRNNYATAIRYLAIDNYFGKNAEGYDIYIRAMSLYCNVETAKKRLTQFVDLIRSWESDGYNKEYPVFLFDDLVCFDGAHRFALATYFGLDMIACNIFEEQGRKDMVHNKYAAYLKDLDWNALIGAEFVDRLEKINLEIDRKYNIRL